MQNTTNYLLKKLEDTDNADLPSLCANFDIIDEALTPTVDQTTTPPTTNQKGKLAVVLGWIANMIKAITGKTNWWEAPARTLQDVYDHITNGTHASATQSESGFMGATDKLNLDTLYSRINSIVKVNLGGTGSALTATLNPVPSSYWDGMIIIGVMPNVSSTTDVTLQLNSLAAKPIKRYGSDGSIQSLPAGALKPYYTYTFASVSYNSCWVVLELTKPMGADVGFESGHVNWVEQIGGLSVTKYISFTNLTTARKGEITFTALNGNIILKAYFCNETTNCLVVSTVGNWPSTGNAITGSTGEAIKCLGANADNAAIMSIVINNTTKKIVVSINNASGVAQLNCSVDWELWA